MKRKPSVAGQFYPGGAAELRAMIRGMIDPRARKEKAIAVVSPHAGYVYSGPVAGAVFSSVVLPRTCVILGPAHRGIAPVFAIQRSGSWTTPLGEVPVETDLADAIMRSEPLVKEDASAHLHEHSLEVQVPFLQFFKEDIAIVPVCVSYEASYEDLAGLGKALAEAIGGFGSDVLIVASTDMSHYISREAAEKKDNQAIDRVLALDAEGLFRTVVRENISMCGFQPVTAALIAAKDLGALKAELIRYQTSGDVTGDYREVVGYAGIRITGSSDIIIGNGIKI
jgi:AmmeMemoRadiSam system protein B